MEAAALLCQARCTITLQDGPPLVFHAGHALAVPANTPCGTADACAWELAVSTHLATEWAYKRALGLSPTMGFIRAPLQLEDPAGVPAPAPSVPASGITGPAGINVLAPLGVGHLGPSPSERSVAHMAAGRDPQPSLLHGFLSTGPPVPSGAGRAIAPALLPPPKS